MTHNAFDTKNNFCNKCGDCCGGYNYTDLTLDDIKRISNILNISMEAFIDRYCYFYYKSSDRGSFVLNLKGGCPFYKDGCSIYKDRPIVCRVWPFHYTPYETAGKYSERLSRFSNCYIHKLDPLSPILYDYEAIAKLDIALELTTDYETIQLRKGNHRNMWDKNAIESAIEGFNKKFSNKYIIYNRCKKLKKGKGKLNRLVERIKILWPIAEG